MIYIVVLYNSFTDSKHVDKVFGDEGLAIEYCERLNKKKRNSKDCFDWDMHYSYEEREVLYEI